MAAWVDRLDAADPSETTIVLDNPEWVGTGKLRAAIHEHCRKQGWTSTTHTTPSVHVIVTKTGRERVDADADADAGAGLDPGVDAHAPDPFADHVALFRKVCGVPVPPSAHESRAAFEAAIDALDAVYGARGKARTFDADVLACGGLRQYRRAMQITEVEAAEALTSHPQFQAFAGKELGPVPVQTPAPDAESRPSRSDVYKTHFVGQAFVSVDIRTANFRVVKAHCPDAFGGPDIEWPAFVRRFCSLDSVAHSRQFRQEFFGRLKMETQIRAAEVRMLAGVQDAVLARVFDPKDLVVKLPDELVYRSCPSFPVADLRAAVDAYAPGAFHVKLFVLGKRCDVPGAPVFLKQFIDAPTSAAFGPIELKGCPAKHVLTYCTLLAAESAGGVSRTGSGSTPTSAPKHG